MIEPVVLQFPYEPRRTLNEETLSFTGLTALVEQALGFFFQQLASAVG